MDGHPHRCSTDFEQALPGGHLARRGVGVCVFITAGPSTKLFAGGGGVYWEQIFFHTLILNFFIPCENCFCFIPCILFHTKHKNFVPYAWYFILNGQVSIPHATNFILISFSTHFIASLIVCTFIYDWKVCEGMKIHENTRKGMKMMSMVWKKNNGMKTHPRYEIENWGMISQTEKCQMKNKKRRRYAKRYDKTWQEMYMQKWDK